MELEVVPERIRPVEFYVQGLRESARIVEHDGTRVAYLRVWSYAGAQNHAVVVETLRAPPFVEADAVVMDLRGGWGGASPEYLDLFNARIPVMEMIARDGQLSRFPFHWRKPAALLVDGRTRSGKELLAHGFRRYGYGPVVGTRTAGAVLGGRVFPVGQAGLLYLAVADVRIDGERLEGHGVEPDVRVAWQIPWAAGRDPQLDEAVEVLAEGIPATP
jgi:carboxyl-terminal processing protease